MSHELYYTSARRGLKPGSQGFCTVAQTRDLPAALAERLEALSTYRLALPPQEGSTARNPVTQAHYRIGLSGRQVEVLSYVSAAGLDYTQRHNKFAHHIVLEAEELPAGGPAWLLQQPGFMARHWEGEPRLLAAGRIPPRGDTMPAVCRSWERAAGDAGWAGVLAEAFLDAPTRVAYLVFELGLDPLPLLAEAMSLLPVERRWEATFSTYYVGLPHSARCGWRCVLADSPEASEIDRLPGALAIRLGATLGRAPDSDLVRQARSGRRSPAKERAPVVRPASAAPVRRPVSVPAYSAHEIPIDEPLSIPTEEAPPPPPPFPPLRTSRPIQRPPGRLLATLAISLLISIPVGVGAFAIGRFLPKQETPSTPPHDSLSRTTDADRLKGGLQAIESKSQAARDDTTDWVAKIADALETAGFPHLSQLLREQEKKLTELAEKAKTLDANIKQTKQNATKELEGVRSNHGKMQEHSKRQLQMAQQLFNLRKILLDHIVEHQQSFLRERPELHKLNDRLDELSKKIDTPNPGLSQLQTEVAEVEKKIHALVKVPANDPAKPQSKEDEKTKLREIFKEAQTQQQRYKSARNKGKKDEADRAKREAKREAERLLDQLDKTKLEIFEKTEKEKMEREINSLRQSLKSDRRDK